jgi:hypothetical protein
LAEMFVVLAKDWWVVLKEEDVGLEDIYGGEQ